jgi:hypothetical protein
MSSNNYDVPVLMYHSIGIPNKEWNWNYLTCPFDKFEKQLQAISAKGYNTITLNQLYDYMVGGKSLPKKAIAITFDDGYLDIFTYAYPLLKKYNMCGTVFINPDFVDPRQGLSAQYNCDGKTDGLPQSGFLNWDEIIKMDSEGVVYSESHALTHTWYPISNKIVDFRHPGDEYKWMTWNDNVAQKYSLQFDGIDLAKYGQPVYEHEKSLMHKRVMHDTSLDKFIIDYVTKNGGDNFFNHANYKQQLMNKVDEYKLNNKMHYIVESDEQFFERIKHELSYTKTILEEKLGRKITFLCWPGGSATKVGMTIAKDLNYQFFNSARDMNSSQKASVKNIPYGGERIKRFTPIIYFNNQENFNSKIIFAGKFWMQAYLYRHQASFISKIFFKAFSATAKLYYKKVNK